jgi:hypothetical protein
MKKHQWKAVRARNQDGWWWQETPWRIKCSYLIPKFSVVVNGEFSRVAGWLWHGRMFSRQNPKSRVTLLHNREEWEAETYVQFYLQCNGSLPWITAKSAEIGTFQRQRIKTFNDAFNVVYLTFNGISHATLKKHSNVWCTLGYLVN